MIVSDLERMRHATVLALVQQCVEYVPMPDLLRQAEEIMQFVQTGTVPVDVVTGSHGGLSSYGAVLQTLANQASGA